MMAVEVKAARWLALAIDWVIDAVLWLMAAPWFVVGWLAGVLAAALLFVAASTVAGFRAGFGSGKTAGE